LPFQEEEGVFFYSKVAAMIEINGLWLAESGIAATDGPVFNAQSDMFCH